MAAGSVDTLVTTYSDRLLTVPNTNPVILNQYGEARLFTSVDLKLVYTSPTGDLTSPIWTEDYVAAQQNVVSDKGYGYRNTNDLYTLDIVPAYTSIPDGFSLVMIPSASSLGTLVIPPGYSVPTVFTGTGINDCVYTGNYLGATTGAVFGATIDACYVEEPATAPTATVSADAAVTPPDAGVHLVAITYVAAEGETEIGPTDSVTADGVHKIDLADILLGVADKGITARRIYMTEAGGSDFYYVDELADVTTDVYAIDINDATLAANDAAPTSNDTGSGAGADTFSWQIDGGTATAGVPIGNSGPQTLQDGIFVEFSNKTGHILGDVWTVTVMTPARLDFCGLGDKLIYKSEGGKLIVLDAGDIIANYPAHLDYSLAEDCWMLINPSLPVLDSLIPLRRRKEITADCTVDPDADQGLEINATGTLTITLPDCIEAVAHFFYFRNGGSGAVTIDAGTYTIKGLEASTMLLNPNTAVQLATNGVDWHVLTASEFIPVGTVSMYAGATAPIGYLLCDGTSYVRTEYAGLFAVIDTVFGVGDDDPNTFNVPDMRDFFPIGASTTKPLGDTVGAGGGLLGAPTVYPAGAATPGIILDADVTGGSGWVPAVDTITNISTPYVALNFIIKY